MIKVLDTASDTSLEKVKQALSESHVPAVATPSIVALAEELANIGRVRSREEVSVTRLCTVSDVIVIVP